MATYYWIGTGGGTWDTTTTTNWSATSGGAGGAGVPGSADTAIFDNNSGSSTITTTASGPISITALTLNTGFIGTVTLGSGLTATGTVTLTQGTLNTNGQTCSWGAFTSVNTNTRSLILGSSSISCSGASNNAWNVTTYTNWSVSAGTSTITLTASSAIFADNSSSTYYNLVFAPTASGVHSMGGAHTFTNLTYIGFGSGDGLFFYSNVGILNTLTLTGAVPPNRILIYAATPGTQLTMSCNGTVVATYVDFQDLKGSGTASWNLSAITGGAGDCGGNSGITFTAAQANYWVGNTANWSNTSAWASTSGGTAGSGRVPLPQDSATFDTNSFTATGKTVTSDCARLGASTTWTTATNSPTWTNTLAWTIYGSLTLASGMSFAAPHSPLVLGGRGAYTITTAAKTMPSLGVAAPGGTYTFVDNVSMSTGILTLTAGTLDAATHNVNVTILQLEISGSTTRQLNMGSGTWTLTNSSGHVCDIGNTGLTLNAGTSTVVVSDIGSSSKVIAMSGVACNFYNLQIASGGTGIVAFGGSSQNWNSIICYGPKNIEFSSGTTNTIATASGWKVNGNSGGVVTVAATTSGTAATISVSSGTIVSQYLSIKDSTVTGGATFYAANSTNVSNNTGWNFSNPAPIGQNMMNGMGA